MMFSRFRRGARPDTISVLYGMIVAQARLLCFYRDYAVADTVNGRFDMVILHLAMVLDRFLPDAALKTLGQGIFDRFCLDMDHNLREIGISDLKVPQEMQRMGEAFYGRQKAYQAALAAPDAAALADALARNVYDGAPASSGVATRLAAYMRVAVRDLAAADSGSLAAGILPFPDPAAIDAATG